MNISELMNTPRFYTAIAEWAACIVYILMLKRKVTGAKLCAAAAGMLAIFAVYQIIAGTLPLYLWIPGMIGAITLMFFYLYLICDISPLDAGFCCVRAFVLAELAASLQWQLYVWWVLHTGRRNPALSLVVMAACYALLYTGYFMLERQHIPKEERMGVNPKELTGAAFIALMAFTISNLSFILPDTPFSTATTSLLYVRTLVDFGGLVMLYAQQDKREELRLWSENDAMNIVLQRQYDQFRLAQDNMQFLRKEFHDLKHYMIAIRAERDPERREQYLAEMENAIHVQESFTDTGNHVLDVVLTTKSAYCMQKNITFNCMADGTLLKFMHVKDICSIFGNALDNAIECVQQYEDPEKRLITLSMFKKNQFIMIRCENYSESSLVLQNSLPVTTKGDRHYHGYGLKSIQAAAQKYGGSITVHSEGSWFTLQILIPIGPQ